VSREVEGGVRAIGRPDAIPLLADLIRHEFGGAFVQDFVILSVLKVEAMASIGFKAFD
jgi:hypothetical protein